MKTITVITSVFLLIFSVSTIFSQTTVTESFDNATFPPTGWTQSQFSGTGLWARVTSGTNPTSSPHSGTGMAYFNCYNYTYNVAALLITPVIDKSNRAGAADTVFFWMYRDNLSSFGTADSVSVWINTAANLTSATWLGKISRYYLNAPAATANTWNRYFFVIPAAFNTANNYIIFRGFSQFGYNEYIDDVSYKTFAAGMTYSSSAASQNTQSVGTSQTNQQIIGVQVNMNGSTSPLSLTQMVLNTLGDQGSTDPTDDIQNARIWYTGSSSTFATTTQFGSAVASPNGAFTVNGSQVLGAGANYFWLTYDIKSSATIGDYVDAKVTSITGTGSMGTVTPVPSNPAGGRLIRASLSGDYTVSTSLFNRLSGRNVYAQKLQRIVKQLVPVNFPGNVVKQRESETSTSLNAQNINYREIETTEDYYELYENGVKYEGPLKVTSNTDGPNSSAYVTITAALADLNSLGVSGAVRLLLGDANYPAETYPLQVNSAVNGMSAVNTLTIKPGPGVTATIPGNITNNATFRILGNNVIIDGSNTIGGTTRDLTIKNTNVTGPSVVLIGSTGTTPITNVNLKNCIIINGTTNNTAIVVSDAATLGNPGYFNGITIQNNDIRQAFIGVYVTGGTTPQNGFNVNILDNFAASTGTNALLGYGLYMQGVNGTVVRNNEFGNMINNTANTYRVGIWLATGTINAAVERNKIHDMQYTGSSGYGASGIKISTGVTGAGISAKNNMIYNITGDADSYASFTGTYSPIGIYCFSTQTGLSIFNNSIFLYGNTLNYSAGGYSIALDIETGTTADVRNNILVNNLGRLAAIGGGSVGLMLQVNNAQLVQCNNNCYSSNATGGGVNALCQIANVNQTTLSGLKTATAKDQQSFNRQPAFISTTNLHINPSDLSVSGRGTYIASVTDDFDGETRVTSQSITQRPVDIGADQYTPSVYTGNTTTLSSGTYLDGGANGVQITAGTLTTTGVLIFPGVRSPNNTDVMSFGNPNGINNKHNGGTVGNSDSPLSVNLPWIYYNIQSLVVTSASVTLKFYYNVDQLATISEANLRVALWNGTTWNTVLVQSVDAVNHAVQVDVPNTEVIFNPALFAVYDLNAPLPVQLCSFNAAMQNRDITLTWKTCSEINNSGFDIERRLQDSKSESFGAWQKVGFIQGHGTTNEEQNYNFKDSKMLTGKYQYRLKQIDFNSNFEYFNLTSPGTIEIGKPLRADVSQNYPNPSNPKSKIDFQIPFNAKVTIKVYDLIGREVVTVLNENKEAGYYSAEFDGTNLSSGVYFYRIQADGEGQTFNNTKKMILVK